MIGQGPRSLSTDQLKAALETATGADLTAYFAAWVQGSGVPAFLDGTVQVTPVASDVSVAVQLSTTDHVARSCAFTVQLQGAGGAHLDVPIAAVPDGGQPPPVTVTPGFAVTGNVLDPYGDCLIFAPGSHKGAGPRANPWHVE